jgi:hypothetical protein
MSQMTCGQEQRTFLPAETAAQASGGEHAKEVESAAQCARLQQVAAGRGADANSAAASRFAVNGAQFGDCVSRTDSILPIQN